MDIAPLYNIRFLIKIDQVHARVAMFLLLWVDPPLPVFASRVFRDPVTPVPGQKLWAVCDLAMGLLLTKTTTFEMREFPSEPRIPPMYFRKPADPNFVNGRRPTVMLTCIRITSTFIDNKR